MKLENQETQQPKFYGTFCSTWSRLSKLLRSPIILNQSQALKGKFRLRSLIILNQSQALKGRFCLRSLISLNLQALKGKYCTFRTTYSFSVTLLAHLLSTFIAVYRYVSKAITSQSSPSSSQSPRS